MTHPPWEEVGCVILLVAFSSLLSANACFYSNVVVLFYKPSLYICPPPRLLCPNSSAPEPPLWEKPADVSPPPQTTTPQTHPGPPAFLSSGMSDEKEDVGMRCSVIFSSWLRHWLQIWCPYPPLISFNCVICLLHPLQRTRLSHWTFEPPIHPNTVTHLVFTQPLWQIFKTHCDVKKIIIKDEKDNKNTE